MRGLGVMPGPGPHRTRVDVGSSRQQGTRPSLSFYDTRAIPNTHTHRLHPCSSASRAARGSTRYRITRGGVLVVC